MRLRHAYLLQLLKRVVGYLTRVIVVLLINKHPQFSRQLRFLLVCIQAGPRAVCLDIFNFYQFQKLPMKTLLRHHLVEKGAIGIVVGE